MFSSSFVRQILCYGRRIPQLEMQMRILQTSKNQVASVLHEYIYDREIAVSAVGQCFRANLSLSHFTIILTPVLSSLSGPLKGFSNNALPDYARLQANMRSLKK